MSIELALTLTAVTIGLLGAITSLFTISRYRNQRDSLELGVSRIATLEELVEDTARQLEESRKTVSDHSRRIAWLDARIRQNRYVSIPSRNPFKTETRNKSNIREQRGRILKLANLGQDPTTIASTLGMMPGEVELILSLSNHKAVNA